MPTFSRQLRFLETNLATSRTIYILPAIYYSVFEVFCPNYILTIQVYLCKGICPIIFAIVVVSFQWLAQCGMYARIRESEPL